MLHISKNRTGDFTPPILDGGPCNGGSLHFVVAVFCGVKVPRVVIFGGKELELVVVTPRLDLIASITSKADIVLAFEEAVDEEYGMRTLPSLEHGGKMVAEGDGFLSLSRFTIEVLGNKLVTSLLFSTTEFETFVGRIGTRRFAGC